MKKSKRRLSLLLALSLSIIPSVSMIGETISHAQTIPKKNKLILSNEFISQIDKFVKVKENNFQLLINGDFYNVIEKYSKKNNIDSEFLANEIKNRIASINKQADNDKIKILKDKSYIELNKFTLRSAGHSVSHYWWGVRHTFNSSYEAKQFGNSLINLSDFVAAASMILPGGPMEDIIGALSSWYLDTLGSDIVSWSKKAPNGFITDIAWTLNYRMYEI